MGTGLGTIQLVVRVCLFFCLFILHFFWSIAFASPCTSFTPLNLAKPNLLPVLVLLLRNEDLPQVTPPPKVIPQLLLCNVLCKTCEVKCRYVALIPPVLSTISLLLSIVACCRCPSRILVEAHSTSLSYITSSPLTLPPTVSLSTHSLSSGALNQYLLAVQHWP